MIVTTINVRNATVTREIGASSFLQQNSPILNPLLNACKAEVKLEIF